MIDFSQPEHLRRNIFSFCQSFFPEWADRQMSDFDMDDPKGFSSFTMGIRAKEAFDQMVPSAVMFRRLEAKENAILSFDEEKDVFLTLAERQVAAQCYHYDRQCRLEAFYTGRTLEPDDLTDSQVLQGIANELHRLHSAKPQFLPPAGFFDLMPKKWGPLAQRVLETQRDLFPDNEQEMCLELREIYAPATIEKVQSCLPKGPLTFCHNDTYHGNIMKLSDGTIKLLDFEFSCLNHKAYDFANLFAETQMEHKLPDYPYFRIGKPGFEKQQIAMLVNFYLDNETFPNAAARRETADRLISEVVDIMLLSDYKYAMAACTLAADPIQKLRFIPYALQRFQKFLAAYEDRQNQG